MYPLAVAYQPRILPRRDDLLAPRAYLTGGVRLIVFRVEILHFPVLATALPDLVLGQFFGVLIRDGLVLSFGLAKYRPHGRFSDG